MRIVHVEDHPLFSDGLRTLLHSQFSDLILSQVSNLHSLLSYIDKDTDLILFDLYLPEMNGIRMMREVRARKGVLPIAFLSASEELEDIKQCMDDGAMGYIPKSLSGKKIVQAISSILEGEKFLTQAHQQAIYAKTADKNYAVARKYALSYKQIHVLNALSEGKSNNEIARRMGITESAIKYHISILFQSFDVKNRVECLRYAQKVGLIDP